jgi:phthalate 4,5-dioxygenase
MLSAADNDLLCRVDPGTAMGEMLQEYWWPVLRSEKLVADGAPERVRLLGRDYVAFRATDGRLGFLDEGCPHRHASLVLARNEGCGLRCLMHGWKVDVDGQVVDTPNEFGFTRPERIKTRNYPVRDSGGMVWVWVGEGEPPPFPELSFATCEPGIQTRPVMAKFRCNWVQLMETLWDPAHVQILHGSGGANERAWEGTDAAVAGMNGEQRFAVGECESRDMPWGFMLKYGRGPQTQMASGLGGWSPTVMPCWIFIGALGGTPDSDRIVFGHVPIDDENTILWQIAYNPSQPLGMIGETLVKSADDPDDWRVPGMSRENNWGQDREAMDGGSWSGIGEGQGITGLLLQDVAMAESMGGVVDRSFENLGPADMGIIKGRRYFLQAVRDFLEGTPAPGVRDDVANVGRAGGAETEDLEPTNA